MGFKAELFPPVPHRPIIPKCFVFCGDAETQHVGPSTPELHVEDDLLGLARFGTTEFQSQRRSIMGDDSPIGCAERPRATVSE
jgi:hypothetical protein